MAYYTAGIIGPYVRDAVVPNLFDISGGNIRSTGSLSVGTFASSNLVTPGYIRNDLAGSLLDISGGNITVAGTITAGSMSAPTTTYDNMAVAGWFRNNLTPTTLDISGGNISNSGTTRSSNFIGTTASASNQIGGVTLSNTNVTLAGTITGSTANTSNSIGGVTLSNTNVTLAGTITGSTANTSNSIGGVTLSNSNVTLAGTITGSTANTSNSIGGVVLSNTNVTLAGTITGSTANTSNSIGGVTLSNTDITLAGTITGSTANTSNVIGGVTLSNMDIYMSATGRILAPVLRNALTPSTYDISGGNISNSGRITNGSGSVSTPSYTFGNDVSMGLYDPATNVLGVVTSGLERMRVSADGRLGIGTTAPATTLDISSSADPAVVLRNSGGFATIRIAGNGLTTDVCGMQIYQGSTDQGLYTNNALPFTIQTNATRRITINSNGNTGIGTTAPVYLLDVNGTTRSSNMLVPGYLRDTIVPSQFDISGGNISNSATHTSSNFIGTVAASNQIGGITLSNMDICMSAPGRILAPVLRNSLTPSTYDISGGNISNSGVTTSSNIRLSASTFVASTALIDAGGGATNFGASGVPTLAIQFAGGGFRHFVRSRHNAAANSSGNAIDFFTNNSTEPQDSLTPGAGGNKLVMSMTSAGVGVGCNAPQNTLDISTGSTFDGIRMTGPSPVLNMYVRGSEANANTLQFFATSTSGGITQFDGTRTLNLNSGINNTPRLVVGTNGNVGIGAGHTGPELALDVSASAQYTAAFRGSGGTQAGIWVVNGAGATTTTGLQMYQNTTGQGLFTASGNAQPMYFWTNGERRMTILNTGNVGVGTLVPGAILDVSGVLRIQRTVGGNINFIQLANISNGAPVIRHGIGIDQDTGSANGGGNLYFNTYNDGGSAIGSPLMIERSSGDIGIGTTTLSNYRLSIRGSGGSNGIIAFHKSGSGVDVPYVGMGYDQTIDASDGLAFFTNNGAADLNGTAMFIGRANRRVGVGTTAPGYRLDVVSTAATDAAINMSTWPRYGTSLTHNVRGTVNVSNGGGSTATFCLVFKTAAVALNTNLGTVTNDSVNGTYFQCKRNGLWDIGLQVHGASPNTSIAIDVSTNITDNANPNAVGHRALAYNTAGFYLGSIRYCGYLPSNDNLYYKFKGNSFDQTLNSSNAMLQITFLGEQPQAAGTWPV